MRKEWSQILVCKLSADGYAEQPVGDFTRAETDVVDDDLESRLCQWGEIVNPMNGHHNQASTFWATRYYEIRNSVFRRELIRLGLLEAKSAFQKIEEQVMAEIRYKDAMLIESAWAKLGDFQQKQVLLMRYVHRHKNEFIRRQLGIRGHKNLRLILWRAQHSIKQTLEREKNAAIIRSDNLNSFAG